MAGGRANSTAAVLVLAGMTGGPSQCKEGRVKGPCCKVSLSRNSHVECGLICRYVKGVFARVPMRNRPPRMGHFVGPAASHAPSSAVCVFLFLTELVNAFLNKF